MTWRACADFHHAPDHLLLLLYLLGLFLDPFLYRHRVPGLCLRCCLLPFQT
jgi:hypothetical protein